MPRTLLVSELNTQIKSLLETTFIQVSVRGEVSALTYHSSGHIYFTIKDENSAIECMMFRGSAQKGLKFRLEVGQDIVCHGAISVYVPRGGYKLNCFSIEPFGVGALSLAFEQLKKDLQAKGYFDAENKKQLPRIIEKIAIVTSATGAALQDMLRVAQKRWPLLKITLLNTLVQGEGSKESIAENIKRADSLGVDVIIVGRGGGSLEDLWAFNERIVAEAIFAAQTPIVSAVGHEVDVMISDFVADLRAPTPSAAMEMILPDMSDALLMLSEQMDRFDMQLRRVLAKKESDVTSLLESMRRYSIDAKLEKFQREIVETKARFASMIEYKMKSFERDIEEAQNALNKAFLTNIYDREKQVLSLRESYENNNPKKRSKSGYAQVVKDHKPADLEQIEVGDEFLLENPNIEILAKAMEKKRN